MKRNIVLIIIIEIALMMLVILALVFGILKSNLKANSTEEANRFAYSILTSYDNTILDDKSFVDMYIGTSNDIIIVGADGTVIANSNPLDDINNPLDLDEFKNLDKAVFRHSKTLGKDMLYLAFIVGNDKIIRIGIPQNKLLSRYDGLAIAVFVVAIILILVLYLLLRLERRNYLKAMSNLLSEIRIKNESPTYEINHTVYESLDDLVILLNRVLVKEEDPSKEALRVLVNELNQGIILVNSDAEIVLSNRLANNLLEIKEGEKVIFQIRDKNIYEAIIDAVNTNVEKIITYTYKNKHIRVLIKSVSSHILTKENDKTGVLVVVSDDTERYTLDKNKRDFFANASHELRSPLTSIKGSAELINLKMVSKEDEQTLSQQIIDNIAIMDKLITDMLELSRLQSNPPKVYNKIKLDDLIKDILKLVNLKVEEKSLIVKLNLEEVDYYGAEQDFMSLFKNLIENAVKYNKEKGLIHISLTKHEEGFKFIVKDTGIGIKEENINRVFERFYQVDKARHLGNPGAGLGLAIVKHIVILYAGKVEVSSKFNEGTTFMVTIP